MTAAKATLEGRVAVIADGGSELGRAIALALSARGVRVVVYGREEKPLGETVGHVVFGGGKARHVVGPIDAAAARAREVFGNVDIVVGSRSLEAQHRVVVEVSRDVERDVDVEHVAELVAALCSSKITGRVLALRIE